MKPSGFISSILLAAAAPVALCFQTALLLDWLFIPNWFYFLIFSISVVCYCVKDLFNSQVINHRAIFSLKPPFRSYPFFIAIGALLVSVYLVFKLTHMQVGFLLAVALIGLAVVRIEHTISKLVLQVLLWTTGTTVLTAAFIPYGFDNRFWCLLVFRFFYLLSVFSGLGVYKNREDTESVLIARKSSMQKMENSRFTYPALLVSAASLIPAFLSGITVLHVLVLLVTVILTFWLVFTRKRNTLLKRSAWPEGLLLLQTLLIWIAMLIP